MAENYISVPTANILHDIPRYSNFRDMIDDIGNKYDKDLAFIVKLKRATKTAPAEYRNISYDEFRKDVCAFGAAIYKKGYTGRRVAIMGKNCYPWIVAYYGVLQGVGLAVPLDKDLPYEELESCVERSETNILVFDAGHYDKVKQLIDSGKFPEMVYICMEGKAALKEPDEKVEDFEDYLALGRTLSADEFAAYKALPIDPLTMNIILFTSGTSGLAKAVMLNQNNILHNCWSTLQVEDIRHGDVNMAFLPLHHTFGSTGLCMMLYQGVTNVFCDGLKYIQSNLIEYKVSLFICVPLLIESVYKRVMKEVDKQGKTQTVKTAMKISSFLYKFGIDVRRKMFKSVLDKLGGAIRFVISGASPLDPECAKGFAAMGVKVVQGYGLTETSPVLASETPAHMVAGSIGRGVPEVELRIDNPNDEGIGELIARGPNVMMGYYKDEEKTKAAIVDGWFHTGDLVQLDEHKVLFIRGRMKNVIVLKNGKNVYPEELEALVSNIPYVAECMVYGEPANKDGNMTDLTVSVRIVYDKEAVKEQFGDIDEAAIQKQAEADVEKINAQIPPYQRIYRTYITDVPMEKTTTGKIKRYKQNI